MVGMDEMQPVDLNHSIWEELFPEEDILPQPLVEAKAPSKRRRERSGDSPSRKRPRSEGKEVKQRKIEVVQAFWGLYFTLNGDASVLKESIVNLYLHIVPLEHRIERNALFLQMGRIFGKDNVSTKQQRYHRLIRGLQIRKPEDLETENPVEYLRHAEVLERIAGIDPKQLHYSDEVLTVQTLSSPTTLHSEGSLTPDSSPFAPERSCPGIMNPMQVQNAIRDLQEQVAHLTEAVSTLTKLQLKHKEPTPDLQI